MLRQGNVLKIYVKLCTCQSTHNNLCCFGISPIPRLVPESFCLAKIRWFGGLSPFSLNWSTALLIFPNQT